MDPHLERFQAVRQSHAPRIMHMHDKGLARITLLQISQQFLDMQRIGGADRIGDHDVIDAHLQSRVNDPRHRFQRGFAEERAGERGGDRQTQLDLAFFRQHFFQRLQRLIHSLASVLQVVPLASADHIAHFIDGQADCLAGAEQIGHQHGQLHPAGIFAPRMRQHRFGVSHLRNRLGMNERGHFHRAKPGFGQRIDDGNLLRCLDEVADVLEPVARPDFDDFDLFGQTHIKSPFHLSALAALPRSAPACRHRSRCCSRRGPARVCGYWSAFPTV